jgi:hypothetical protein
MSESEATAIRFTIDHYEPRSARPDLEKEYSNLYWCCDECNLRKGDITPPDNARAAGYRVFRVDEEISSDHFELHGLLLKRRSNVGEFTIDVADLNRSSLRRLRDLRLRLVECDAFVSEGIAALRRSNIDRLKPDVRGRAFTAIMRTAQMAEQLADDIDDHLRMAAKSSLIDPDPESAERAADRRERMKTLKGLFEGTWRGRNSGQEKK